MIAALTTARKATAGGLVSFFSPLYVIVQSGQELTWRAVLGCAIAGALGWLAVWAPENTVPYEPRHASVRDD